MTRTSIAVVGGGVAGASAARALADAGYRVVVHDKGRVPGGRAATRSGTETHFDHGAQYFTARDPAFRAQVEVWKRSSVIDEWRPRLVSINADGGRGQPSPEPRWVGMPGMNRLAQSLLEAVDVRCGNRVIGVERRDGLWWLQLADGSEDGPHGALLCTLPAPQVAALLAGESLAQVAAQVVFAPCWAVMLQFGDALEAGLDAAFVNAGPISWLARDSSKPGRPAGERWVVHAGPQHSRARLETPAETVSAELTAAFFDALDIRPRPALHCSAHRWRHALAESPLHEGALVDASRRLAIGGDWCHGSRVEGAWLSGRALARSVDAWFKPLNPG